MNAAYTLGRILIPLVFLVEGIQKVINVERIAKMLADNNVPIPDQIVPYLGGIPKYQALGYLVAAVEIICGLMILVGPQGALGRARADRVHGCTIIFVHHFWDMSGDAFFGNHDRGAEEPVDHGRAAAGRGRRSGRADCDRSPLSGRPARDLSDREMKGGGLAAAPS